MKDGDSVLKRVRNRYWRESWNIATVAVDPTTLCSGTVQPRLESWLFTDSSEHFHADPFLIERDGAIWLFCEQYSWARGLGRIICCEIVAEGPGWRATEPREIDLACPGHLAYPCVFEHDGQVFMIPESADSRSVDLYRESAIPETWVKECTLLDFPGLDATYFQHGGWHWLLTARAGAAEHTELHAFWAADLTGPWRAHPHNPIKQDRAGARPAGFPFRVKGQLYRPAQDCRGTYGRRITITRVDKLSPEVFHEVTVGRLEPASGSAYSCGLHTLAMSPHLTVVDGKCFTGLKRWLGPAYAALKGLKGLKSDQSRHRHDAGQAPPETLDSH